MATRPIYIAQTNSKINFVTIKEVDFKWFPGMAISQKQKSIADLHKAAESIGISIDKILEISSKSKQPLGVALSAFNLCLLLPQFKKRISVECLFQGSKVFELGGPFIDLYDKSSRDAKTDDRLKNSGNLLHFSFTNTIWKLNKKTAFYDWLYLTGLYQNRELSDLLLNYDACTDIEFNPKKSMNCQAYSAALYISLSRNGLIKSALTSPENFCEIMSTHTNEVDQVQGKLF